MEIGRSVRGRRNHPEAFKRAVIAACCEPGASVAGIALANGVNANQVRRWMRERGLEPPKRKLPALADESSPAFVPVSVSPAVPTTPDIRIEIRRGNAAVKIEWPAQSAADCAAWLRDWLK